MTNTILVIVALDDGPALILYSFAFAFSKAIVGSVTLGFKIIPFQPLLKIFGSIVIGIVLGFLADKSLQLSFKSSAHQRWNMLFHERAKYRLNRYYWR